MKYTQKYKAAAILAIGAIILPLAAGWLAPNASAESAIITSGNPYYTKVSAPVLKPLWSFTTAAVNNPQSTQTVTALAENGTVFALQNNYKLIALKAATGKKIWEFGSALAPLFIYNSGNIYGLTQKGSLYAVKENGTKLWSTDLALPNASSIQKIGNTVYVTQGIYLAAVDAASGKLKWKINLNSGYYGLDQLAQADGVVLRTYIGESVLALSTLVAYDAESGKKLWEQYRHELPLAIKDGLLYSVKNLAVLDEDPVNRKIPVSVINVKTGEIKGERQYRWTETANPDIGFRSGGAYGSAFLDGDSLYIFQGDTLARYDFWKYSADGTPQQVWEQAILESEAPLYKVHQQRMLFINYGDQSLAALKLANGQVMRLPAGENPAVQLDIFGSTIYTGQSDGLFHAYDFISYKPLFTVNTGSRDFAPTLKTGSTLIVRSGGKLMGVKLPASIK
ncbi:PQQ-binding-like beta-propeller repeat protein [Paenibacillus camerounensis]|uniref:PQQ-binding-like beta-propeller repeat protein n=1 Tax=Paenibacillus camerounensis TaxID=1243663 RepID=UPI0005A5E2F9|nr:PQQ-binding-like beta-propeller repeat protein [Paenibacillus camerounensis]